MRVVVAPDKFKGSLTAVEVAEHVSIGLRAVMPALDVVAAPVADGGDGTIDVALAAGFEAVPVTVSGPTGRLVRTAWARRGDVALVEMATVCGLLQLPSGVPDPLNASSYGLGEAVLAAARAGCTTIMLGVGGSASTDGGAGMLEALGAVIVDADGAPVPRGGAALAGVALLDMSGLDSALDGIEFIVACDVANPLCGPDGAAAVYGPQKGATPGQVHELDAALACWAKVVGAATRTDHADDRGAGGAGGVPFAAVAALGARLVPGIDLVLDLIGFSSLLSDTDLVITGEGTLDEQTIAGGKAPAGVSAIVRAAGIPIVAVAGCIDLSPAALRDAGLAATYALIDLEPDVHRCITDPGPLLQRIGRMIATEHLAQSAAEGRGSRRA